MKELTQHNLPHDKNNAYTFVFIHTPFCGTCKLARKMLETIEGVWEEDVFFDMNASLFPKFMEEKQIESVPCLLVLRHNQVIEKIYAFRSVPNIYELITKYKHFGN